MIDIIPNTSSFRKIPFQSGVYSLELDINLGNHFNDVDFALSGGGSVFFRFGSNSGHYYASGLNKVYFDSTSPNTDLNYTFVISQNSFDVYKNSDYFILNAPKNTGICERILNRNSQNAEGQFSFIVRGDRPSFHITSGLTIPSINTVIDNLVVYNDSSIPFNVLSGTIDNLDFISGVNRFPLFINSYSSGLIPFSGKINSLTNQNISLILNSDFINTANVVTITGTNFSGSGYVLVAPDSSSVDFGSFENVLWVINNTGNIPLQFSPRITKIVTGINIDVPRYSGSPVYNYFSGYFDTASKFYFSDKITWSGGAFHIIQENSTGINLINVTGDVAGTEPSGLLVGTDMNTSVGQTFNFPFDFYLTGLSVKLALTGSGFISSDTIFVTVYNGNGVSGSILSNSNELSCLNVPFGIFSGSFFDFNFPSPILLNSGNQYSLAIRGSPTFIGNTTGTPSRQIMLLSTTGNIYTGGSGFINSGSSTVFTTGDALMRFDWMPPLNTHRYKINPVVGNLNQFNTVATGIYDKYQDYLSFVFSANNYEALPNFPINFEMTYTGLVSGLNFVRLDFDSLGYSTIISGFTV